MWVLCFVLPLLPSPRRSRALWLTGVCYRISEESEIQESKLHSLHQGKYECHKVTVTSRKRSVSGRWRCRGPYKGLYPIISEVFGTLSVNGRKCCRFLSTQSSVSPGRVRCTIGTCSGPYCGRYKLVGDVRYVVGRLPAGVSDNIHTRWARSIFTQTPKLWLQLWWHNLNCASCFHSQPNDQKKAGRFDEKLIRHQIRYLGWVLKSLFTGSPLGFNSSARARGTGLWTHADALVVPSQHHGEHSRPASRLRLQTGLRPRPGAVSSSRTQFSYYNPAQNCCKAMCRSSICTHSNLALFREWLGRGTSVPLSGVRAEVWLEG